MEFPSYKNYFQRYPSTSEMIGHYFGSSRSSVISETKVQRKGEEKIDSTNLRKVFWSMDKLGVAAIDVYCQLRILKASDNEIAGKIQEVRDAEGANIEWLEEFDNESIKAIHELLNKLGAMREQIKYALTSDGFEYKDVPIMTFKNQYGSYPWQLVARGGCLVLKTTKYSADDALLLSFKDENSEEGLKSKWRKFVQFGPECVADGYGESSESSEETSAFAAESSLKTSR